MGNYCKPYARRCHIGPPRSECLSHRFRRRKHAKTARPGAARNTVCLT
ncbi:hypothetical protein O8B40_16725 [Agrobacterium rhizogenes]|nr:hypothetical protein [Rhizobium rhizogenes]MCZ7448293.1 hypothetical protein [Rhizobium rhizogenes]MCZ7465724.1 hypothetical protein [Rhizobium rhizogenes]